ncbi:MAG TPA: helix-turn-helix transcriptional regulator [Streptosporangiaceae bacterium]|nr:helix-turn-helix transcriptional regulator [Streptosporangiaceae bacterium]
MESLLRQLRLQHGLTQEALTERSGVSIRTIRNLEYGVIELARQPQHRIYVGGLTGGARAIREPDAVAVLAYLAEASLLYVEWGKRYEYRMLNHVQSFMSCTAAC